jgi:hypothetical protein
MMLDMADVKPTIQSWLIVTLMAIAGIIAAKVILNRWKVPGLTDLVNAV